VTGTAVEGLRDRKKRLTREALSRAAVDLVAERGLDNVTVEDISAAADVSPRTFFNYFASKEDAVLLPDPATGARLRAGVLAQPPGVPVTAAVREALLAELTAVLNEDRELWLRRMRVVQEHPVLLARVLSGGEEVEREVVAAVAERSGLPVDATYPMLLGATTGAAFRVAVARWSATQDGTPLSALVTEVFDLLAAGLAHPPQS
jgi:AcrR family transcriptional regulator